MAGFVADASATLPWCFAEEATPATEALLVRLRTGETAVVPAHWPAEVMNAPMVAVRRGRIDPERIARFARDLAALPIRIEQPHAAAVWSGLIRVASEYQPYMTLPIWNSHLRKAATAAGVLVET